jgi:argininosuccinate lyase
MMNLSRLSEELIIWSTSEWNFVKLADEYSHDLPMPQKKNPDIAELFVVKREEFGKLHYLVKNDSGLPC